MHTWRFDAIGTVWQVESERALSPELQSAVTDRIENFDREWSRFRADSLVSRLAANAGPVQIPADAAEMLELYRQVSDASDAAINPLVGESLAALGYDTEFSLRADKPTPAPANWREILRWDAQELHLIEPHLIDVGAIGKGRLVDLVFDELIGVPGELVVDAGGDLRVRGNELRVGLEHPLDPQRAVGVATLVGGALCASAVNRRAWGDGFHHILDARTGEPVRTIVATWAIAPTAMVADAAASVLFFDEGPRWAASQGIEWVRMTSAGAVEWSPGFGGELFV